VISFRQVADQRPDAAAGEVREALADLHAQHELWPEPAERVADPQPPMPRYRRIG
jgi:hypothetical protein